jgi:outer membrane immunogenic protein
MKKILLAALMLVGPAATAFAADIPSRKAPVVAPVAAAPLWTGLYLGANAGYAFGTSSQRDQVTTYPSGLADGAYKPKGALGGVTAGYNWQSQALVYGLEGDLSVAGISGSSSVCGVGAVPLHLCGTKADAFGTVRARGGFAIDSTLIYATGGLAVARIKAYDAGFPNVAAQSGSAVRLGWTVGAGVEQKLDAHWSVKAEYLYASFARASYFTLEGFTPEKVDLSANILRAGVNYKF